MLVELIDDIFRQGDPAELRHLISVCLYRGRHTLRVEIHKVRLTQSYDDLPKRDKQLLEDTYAFKSFVARPSARVRVSEARNSQDYYNIEEATRYLSQTYSIALENSLNDQHFLQAIIKHLSVDPTLQYHLANGWAEYINGGGCNNIPNVMEGKANSFNDLPKSKYRYLRAFAIFDSDRLYPTAPEKDSYRIALPRLTKMGVHHHVLEKRAMENYLPDEAFNEIDTMTEAYKEAYLRMTPFQKDHFSVNLGFSAFPSRAHLSPEVALLYSSLSDADFETLSKGANMAHFKSEFPKFMANFQVHRSTIKRRTQHQQNPDELEDIIQRLTAEL